MWAFFTLSVILVVLAVLYMVKILPAKGVPAQVLVVTGYAYLTTLLICCIVPLDVQSTLAGQNQPAIVILWDISYWSTQLLTWLLIPLYMGYADAGEFTWRGRMWASASSNLAFYMVVGTVGGAALLYAILNDTISLTTLPSLGMQLSNTFGLVCVLTLLGYGIVQIPRLLWKRSNPEAELRHQLYRLGRICEEKEEAQRMLDVTVAKVKSTERALGNGEIEARARIAAMVAFIRDMTGEDVENRPAAGRVADGVKYADELAQLHKEIKKEVYWVGAINVRGKSIVQQALRLTEIVDTRKGQSRASRVGLEQPEPAWERLRWNFVCFGLPYILKGLALCAAALSLIILWCEVTTGFSRDLSPLSHMIRSVSAEFVAQFLIMAPLVYFIACTYTAFFSINVGSLYMLTPTASSSFSMLFNGTMMARFAAPLCNNYLHVIGMNTGTSSGHYTVFAQKMGYENANAVAIPFLGTDFNRWAPLLILLVFVLTATNFFGAVYKRFAECTGLLPGAYSDDENDDESNSYVLDGQRALAREMQNLQDGLGVEARTSHNNVDDWSSPRIDQLRLL